MNTKGLSLASIALWAAGGLYGCSDGDETVINITSTDVGGGDGGDSGFSVNCPAWSLARQQDAGGNDVCQLPDALVESHTLTNDVTWFLDDTVLVGNGHLEMGPVQGTLLSGDPVLNVTLTIEAGTHIRGRDNGALVITRGSQIQANGTVDAPIIFSSDDDGFDGSGEWGGLVIHGYAPHNVSCNPDIIGAGATCNYLAEGGNFLAGGTDPDDDSGTLRYVIVAEGGLVVSSNNEINGISLASVGRRTTMEYIQVHNNLDDGIEWFGGTVDARYIVLTGNEDDSMDWDEGWQGNVQYALIIQGAATTGTAIEADSEGASGTLFLSKPTIANATYIGNGANPELLNFKARSGGMLLHTVLTFDASVVGPTTCINDVAAEVPGTYLVFEDVVGDCEVSGDVTLLPAPIADVQLDGNYASQAAEAQAAVVGQLDITGFNSTYLESVADPLFFDDTDYAGAVDPTAAGEPWWAGWTIEGSL